MSDVYMQDNVNVPVKLNKTDKTIVELLQKFSTEEEKPFIVLKRDITPNGSKKLPGGQILEVDKIFNNINLTCVAFSYTAVPVFSQNPWGGKIMYSWFPDVADAVIANISKAQNTGGWPVDKQKVKDISTLLNEMKQYISWCNIESGKYFPSDDNRYPAALISGTAQDQKVKSPKEDSKALSYGKSPYSFTVDMEIKLKTPEWTITNIEASRRIYTEIALQDLHSRDTGDIVMFINALDNYTRKNGIYMHTSDDVLLNTLEAAKQNKTLVFSLYNRNHEGKNLDQQLEYFTGIMQGIAKGLARAADGKLRPYYEKYVEKDLIEHFVK